MKNVCPVVMQFIKQIPIQLAVVFSFSFNTISRKIIYSAVNK
jgi:hypothetical protein